VLIQDIFSIWINIAIVKRVSAVKFES